MVTVSTPVVTESTPVVSESTPVYAPVSSGISINVSNNLSANSVSLSNSINKPIMSTPLISVYSGKNDEFHVVNEVQADIHHAHGSQNVKGALESESTLSASEREDDVLTPGQKFNEDIGISLHQETTDEDLMTVEVDSEQYASIFKDEGKRTFVSSDEENSIMMNIGNFVNSFNIFTGGSQEKKKKKVEKSQDETENVHDV